MLLKDSRLRSSATILLGPVVVSDGTDALVDLGAKRGGERRVQAQGRIHLAGGISASGATLAARPAPAA